MTELFDTEGMTEKQRRVLEAALEVFAEKGYAGASTSEIAKRAGVAEGTIFRHYKTKKELLISVVAPFFFRWVAPQFLKEVERFFEQEFNSFEDFVRAFFQNRYEFTRKHQKVLRVVAQELPFHPEVRALALEFIADRLYPVAKPVIERFQARGEVVAGDPASILRRIASLLMGFVLPRFLLAPELAWDDEAEMELTVKVVVDGLRPR